MDALHGVGQPGENGYGESFNGRLGDELLKREEFAPRQEAQVLVEEYREHYNWRRPPNALGYQTTMEFAASWEPKGADQDLTKELPRS